MTQAAPSEARPPLAGGEGEPLAASAAANGSDRARRWRQAAPGLALIAALLAVYGPILYHVVIHWQRVQDYSHGFLIVPLALYFVWERRAQIAATPIQTSWWGVPVLAAGALSLAVGRLGVELTTMRWGFVLSLCGIAILMFGRPMFRVVSFPLLFLFLMVPLPQSLMNQMTFPLQLIAASGAVEALHWIRVPALLEGNIVHLANATLFVAQACSGLRSLMALITLGVVFAYFFRQTTGERVIIVLSAIPIAILVNAVRVALTGVLTYHFGEQAAKGVIHEFQGLITFGAAFLLLLLEARALELLWHRSWRPVAAGGTP